MNMANTTSANENFMLLRNTLWNLMGEGLPMVAAVAAIPLLIQQIGMERFGALTLLWALLGYFALLDLGLVRSLVQVVSERLGYSESTGSNGSLADIIFPVFAAIAGLGLVAAVGLAAFAGPLAAKLEADPHLIDEVRHCLYIVAGIVPIALLSAGLRGLLEAHQHFRTTNLVRMSVGVLNYLSPLAILPFDPGLPSVLAAIAVGRLSGFIALAVLCRRLIPLSWVAGAIRPDTLRPLFAMGAWMTASNLIGPVMMYADRFILGAGAAAGAIAYYTTPFEMVTRLLFFPAAIAGVLFPMAARQFHHTPQALPRILALGVAAVLGVYGIGVMAVAVGGGSLLEIWLGADFAANSRLILTVLMLGVLLNGAAYMPYVMLQGIGRVDITAKLQLAELPAYLLVLWLLVQALGPLGAAIAWCLRTGCDFFLLLLALSRLTPQAANRIRQIAAVVAAAIAAAVAGLLLGGPLGTAALLAGQGAMVLLAGGFLWRAWQNEERLDSAARQFPAG